MSAAPHCDPNIIGSCLLSKATSTIIWIMVERRGGKGMIVDSVLDYDLKRRPRSNSTADRTVVFVLGSF